LFTTSKLLTKIDKSNVFATRQHQYPYFDYLQNYFEDFNVNKANLKVNNFTKRKF